MSSPYFLEPGIVGPQDSPEEEGTRADQGFDLALKVSLAVVDRLVDETYAVNSSSWHAVAPVDEDDSVDDDLKDESDGGDDDRGNSVKATASWAVGVAFGRFDVRLATGERLGRPKPDLFRLTRRLLSWDAHRR